MFRSLVTNKIALAVVALVPWIVGEVASFSGCAAGPVETAATTGAVAPEVSEPAPCVIYETASGRLVTVKAPASKTLGADCVRI